MITEPSPNHTGEVELTDEQAAAVKRFVADYPYVLRSAVEKAVAEGQEISAGNLPD